VALLQIKLFIPLRTCHAHFPVRPVPLAQNRVVVLVVVVVVVLLRDLSRLQKIDYCEMAIDPRSGHVSGLSSPFKASQASQAHMDVL